MQNNARKRSYSEALVSPAVSDQAQNFNNQSRNKKLKYDQVLNLDPQSSPPYRQIANLAIQGQLFFNKVLGVVKWIQLLARNQMCIEERQQILAHNQMCIEERQQILDHNLMCIEERQNNVLIDSAPLSQRPSSSSFNSKSNHLIDSNKSK
jgi:hypothetical protein